jgi:4-diphosphocytidyl-2-C-methyl-D-erythritol kinase
MDTPYEIKAPAKLNIRLKVTGRRPDGYHDLVSIMVPVALFDLLEFRTLCGGIRLACDGTAVPEGPENLVFRAACAFFTRTGIRAGISIRLFKRIPVAAGMGGGSSDAAATLLALNRLWSEPLKATELEDLAAGLGADVPFFIHCRPSVARGIGDILEPLREWPGYWYVIVRPPFEVSTAWAFGRLKLKLTSDEGESIINFLGPDFTRFPDLLENDLERVTAAEFPVIETIKGRLLEAGAEGAMMTGSGPTVFGLFLSAGQALRAKESIISQNLGDVFVAADWQRPLL